MHINQAGVCYTYWALFNKGLWQFSLGPQRWLYKVWFLCEVLIPPDSGNCDLVNDDLGADVNFQLAFMWPITCGNELSSFVILNLWSIHWHFFYKCQRADDEWKESSRVTAVINSLAQSHFLVAFSYILWCRLPGKWMFKNHSPLLSSQTVFLGGRGRRRSFWIFEPNPGSSHWTNYFFTGLKIDLLFMSNLFYLKRLLWRYKQSSRLFDAAAFHSEILPLANLI